MGAKIGVAEVLLQAVQMSPRVSCRRDINKKLEKLSHHHESDRSAALILVLLGVHLDLHGRYKVVGKSCERRLVRVEREL